MQSKDKFIKIEYTQTRSNQDTRKRTLIILYCILSDISWFIVLSIYISPAYSCDQVVIDNQLIMLILIMIII